MDTWDESKTLLKARDVAQRWKVTEAYVYALARTGELPSIRFGERRNVRFFPDDVLAFEEERRTGRKMATLKVG